MESLTSDPALLFAGLVVVSAVAIVSIAALLGWRDYIALRRDALALGVARRNARQTEVRSDAGSGVEIAALKDRLRALEAIAAGVDP